MVKLGKYVKGDGIIPGGADAGVVYRLFTAGDKPVLWQYGHFYGGDAGEFACLILLAPSSNTDLAGEKTATHYNEIGNGITVLDGNIVGGLTAAQPFSLISSYQRPSIGQAIYIPPHYILGVYCTTASTAQWNFAISGFECEDYA